VSVGGEVERLLAEVVAADERLHLAGRVLDRDERHRRADAADLGDGGVGRGLQLRVERRLDLHAAAEDAVGAEPVDRLLRDPGREIGLIRVRLGRVDVVFARRDLYLRLVVLLLRDHLLLEHPVEHEVLAPLRRLEVLDRVVGRGRGDDAGQERCLSRGCGRGSPLVAVDRLAGHRVDGDERAVLVEDALLLAEVGSHRGLDPVRAVAEVHGVQVLGEDLLLGPLAFEVVRGSRLAQLLEHGTVALGCQGVLHELLRDRRCALLRASAEDVLPQRAADAPVVHAAVLVEAPVLDRDNGVLDVRRDLVLVHEDAVLVARQLPELVLLVGVGVEDRVLGVLELDLVLEVRNLGRDRHHHPEDHRDEGDEAEARGDQRDAQLLELRPLRRPAVIAPERVDGRGRHRRWRWRGLRQTCRFDRLLHVRAEIAAQAMGTTTSGRQGAATRMVRPWSGRAYHCPRER
jgi:hypothetical protein